MKTRSFVLVASLALTAVSCSGSLEPGHGRRVAAIPDKTNYYTGETIHVEVKNLTGESLVFPAGFCPAVLERWSGDDWTREGPAGGCALVLQLLGAHATVVFERPVPDGQGLYRFLLPEPIPDGAPAEAPLVVEFTVNSTAF